MAQVGQSCCVGGLCPGRNTVVAHAHQSARQYKQDPNKSAHKDQNNYSNKKNFPKFPRFPSHPFFALPSSHSLLHTPIFTLTLPTKHRGQINGAGPTAARASLCFGLGLAAKDVQQLERGQQGLGVGLAAPFLKISKIEKNVSIDHTRNCIQT